MENPTLSDAEQNGAKNSGAVETAVGSGDADDSDEDRLLVLHSGDGSPAGEQEQTTTLDLHVIHGATDDEVRNAVESVESEDEPELVTGGGVPRDDDAETTVVEFRNRSPERFDSPPVSRVEIDPHETTATCDICGYHGLVPRTEVPVEGVLSCGRCGDIGQDEPELVTDGGVPLDGGPNAQDDAELIQVRGEHDGVATLSVYYRVGPTTFRARLRPVRPLPEEDHIRDREALVLSDLCSLDVPDLDGFEFVGPDAPAEEWFDTTHVPPVVRRAVDRPVQVPDLGNVQGDPSGR